jgi:hypothetical protein
MSSADEILPPEMSSDLFDEGDEDSLSFSGIDGPSSAPAGPKGDGDRSRSAPCRREFSTSISGRDGSLAWLRTPCSHPTAGDQTCPFAGRDGSDRQAPRFREADSKRVSPVGTCR